MKKRILSFLLAVMMVGSSACSIAAEPGEPAPHASLYLDGYGAEMDAKGGGKMVVTFIVFGTDDMSCIGAQQIVVEEWDGVEWTNPITYTAAKNPSFYAYDASEHMGSVTFYGIPGLQYRATLTAYASLNGGYGTGTVVSNTETCY